MAEDFDDEEVSEKHVLVVLGVLSLITIAIFTWWFSEPRGVGYAPKQPIPYSHKLHAGKLKIDCQYCHSAVSKSSHSNVPSVGVCMNCHTQVKTDSPHIQKLHEAYESGKPVEWINVHVLPDFVYFNHKRHVAKGVSCEKCHGNIQDMEVVEQRAPLTMGWCVNCHREPENNAPINCNTCHR